MAKFMDRIRKGRELRPRRALVYGVHGVGKSCWAACADKPIFIPIEDGLSDIDTTSFPLAESYADVISYLSELYSEDHDFQTVVIDSLDWLERLIWENFCQKRGVKSIEEVPYARGYKLVLEQWHEVFAGLDALRQDRDMHIILVAHAAIEKFENPETDSYDRFAPKINKHACAMVQEWCDEVFFANYKVHTKTSDEGFGRKKARGIGQGERVLYTTELPAHNAKNRLGMPDEIPLDFNVYRQYYNPPEEPKPNKNEKSKKKTTSKKEKDYVTD